VISVLIFRPPAFSPAAFLFRGDAIEWPEGTRRGLSRCRRRIKRRRQNPDVAIWQSSRGRWRSSAQEWMLKMRLKIRRRTGAVRKDRPQMLHGLQQRLNLSAHRWRLLPAQTNPHPIQPALQPPLQPIDRFQGKRQPQFFHGGLDRKPGQHFHQPLPHQRCGQGVCRGKMSASIIEKVPPQPPRRPRLEQNTRWPRTTWPLVLTGSLPRRKLCRFSVSIFPQRGQRCCLREKAGTATLARRAQNEKGGGTSRLVARKPRPASSFFDGTSRRRNSVQKGLGKSGTALTALHPHSDRKLIRICDPNSAQTRRFLRRHCGT